MKHTYSKCISALSALLITLNMTGCGKGAGAPDAPAQASNLAAEIAPQTVSGKEPDAEFCAAQTSFSLSLMQQSVSADAGRNVLISPYSVMQALAMTANGAAGDTRTEMEQTLGGIPTDTLNSYLYYQRTAMPDSENSRLKTANSVWFRDDSSRISLLPEFLQNAADYYAAGTFSAPFDEQTRTDINQWCSEQTNGMIPAILSDPIPPDAVMYLINAVCFEAKWAHIYEDQPTPREFRAADGTVQQAQMMYSEENRYLADAHAAGFLKPYQNGDYAFAAILPEDGMTPESYLMQLTPDALQNVLAQPEICNVRAGLPQFSYDYDMLMNDALTAMGMPAAFQAENADFSNMAKTDSGTLFISRVLHKTHIDVDTEGTKAAAVTAVEMSDEAAAEEPEEPKYVILDRPFVYMIIDMHTLLPVFFGVLNSVE